MAARRSRPRSRGGRSVDALNRQLRSGVSDETLAELVGTLRDEDRLCIVHEEDERQEPSIICSMGLIGQ